jgi:hypothetical protein
MTLGYWTDLHLMATLPDATVASAIATGLDISPFQVVVGPSGSQQVVDAHHRVGLRALVQWENTRWDAPNTRWPIEYRIAVEGGAPPDQEGVQVAIVKALGVPVLTDFVSDDQDTFRLILPTGEALPRVLDDDEGDIVYEPGDAERLAPYLPKDALPLAS